MIGETGRALARYVAPAPPRGRAKRYHLGMSRRGWSGWSIVCALLLGVAPASCDKQGTESKQPGAQPAKQESAPEPEPEVDPDYEARKAAAVKELEGMTGND